MLVIEMKTEEIKILLKDIYCSASQIFRDKLIASILFGSYARGDYDSESDMDVALIVSCKRDELKDYQDALVKEMSRLTMQYGVLVNFTEIPDDEYKKYGDALPFYRNVHQEGVYLSS